MILAEALKGNDWHSTGTNTAGIDTIVTNPYLHTLYSSSASLIPSTMLHCIASWQSRDMAAFQGLINCVLIFINVYSFVITAACSYLTVSSQVFHISHLPAVLYSQSDSFSRLYLCMLGIIIMTSIILYCIATDSTVR